MHGYLYPHHQPLSGGTIRKFARRRGNHDLTGCNRLPGRFCDESETRNNADSGLRTCESLFKLLAVLEHYRVHDIMRARQ